MGSRNGVLACPAVEPYGYSWICRSEPNGKILVNFDGVGYCDELGCFVKTEKVGLDRQIRVLGSKSYKGALEEAKDLAKQMCFEM